MPSNSPLSINIPEGKPAEKEHYYKQILQNLPGAIYICDAKGCITFYNKPAADLWGREPIIGQDMWCGSWKIYRPDGEHLPLDSCPMAIALKEGRAVFNEEIIVEQPSGIRRNILPHPQPIFDTNGTVVGAFNMLLDITERKKEEEKKREKRKSLEILNKVGRAISSELELDKVVQAVTDAATQISRAQFGTFFYNLLDDKGGSYTLYAISGVPKERFEKFPIPRNTAFFGPTFHGTAIIRSSDITKDTRYGKNPPFHGMPKGHLPVKSYLAVPVVSRTGAVIGGLVFGHSESGIFTQRSEDLVAAIASQAAIAMDNSKLYEASKKDKAKLAEINAVINKKNEELQKINIDLDNFIYTASHDLKAPIANIEGLIKALSKILKKDNPSQSEINAVLKMMEDSTMRFSSTINDLTTITKIQKEIEEEVVEKVNLHEVIEDIKFINGDLFANSGARIFLEPEIILDIFFPRRSLKSILYNLITNAIKFRSPNRVPKIKISTKRKDDYIILSVQDNGLGLDEHKQKKLFSMFKRFHDHVEGTGIGLYLVKRIITNSGGKIEVESQVNVGTTFHVYFKDGIKNN